MLRAADVYVERNQPIEMGGGQGHFMTGPS
jgi:hypothetical protein